MTVWVAGLFFFPVCFWGIKPILPYLAFHFQGFGMDVSLFKNMHPHVEYPNARNATTNSLNWLLQNYDQTISNLCSLSKMLISTPTHWFFPLNFWSSYASVSVIADLHRWWTISCNQNIGWTSNQFDSLVMFPLSIFAWLGDGPTVQR